MDESYKELLEKVFKMGLGDLRKLSEFSPFAIYYHNVTSEAQPLPLCSTPVTAERFRSDLRLLGSVFRHLPVDEFLWHLRNGKPFPKGSFMITFDDTLATCHTFAAPILEEFKLDAVFFINSMVVGNRALLTEHRTRLLHHIVGVEGLESVVKPRLAKAGLPCERLDQIIIALRGASATSRGLLAELEGAFGIDPVAWAAENKPYMDEAQIEDLARRGFLIGAHGRDHFRFREIPIELQMAEFEGSVKYVASRFKPKAMLFAFPFTANDASYAFFEKASQLGVGVEAFFGVAAPLVNPGMPWLIERLSLEFTSDTERYLADMIRTEIVKRLAGCDYVERA